jgi:uncharacterized repeat protein (TIGR01451 family)
LASATPPSTAFTPSQIHAAYGIDPIIVDGVTGDGSGQTIAIVDAYDDPSLVDSTAQNFSTSDLACFDAQFGLPDPPSFEKLDQYGGTNYPTATSIGNWTMEESLDVQWAHAMAPRANIVLVEANSSGSSDLLAAVATAANLPGVAVVSMSFAMNESASNAPFVTPAGHAGVTFVAASGDYGGGHPFFPAFSPNVVAVGGTTLTLSNGQYSETGWSGSGGGQSACQLEPPYQNAVQSSGFREAPDVAFDADPNSGVPVYDSYDFGSSTPWVQVGGTSLAAPCWGGLLAIADQFRAAQGLRPLDGPTETLPDLYHLPSSDFNDITSGSNGYLAHAGYDLVTGLGTPTAATVAGLAMVPGTDLCVDCVHSGNFRQGDTGDSYTITVTNSGTAATAGSVSLVDALPAGLTATAMSGPGWTVDLATLTATRSDVLAGDASYPPLTLTVNVAGDAPTTVTNVATVSGGGQWNTANDAAGDPTSIAQAIDMTVTASDSGNFKQDDVGDSYTISVSNVGFDPTSGGVSVVDAIPAGLSPTAMGGPGWTVDRATLTATRSDVLAAGASYPPLTVTVDVAANAPASATNVATVSGGGETNTANDTASDATAISPVPDLTLDLSHSGDFRQGDAADLYTITVTNSGGGATSGVVSVADTLPAGLTATAISGTGWTVNPAALVATRSDVLAAGASYPPLTVTAAVAADAPPLVANLATVSGGGEVATGNDTASDATNILNAAGPPEVLSISPSLGGVLAAGSTASLTVHFSKAVLGGGSAANYVLQAAGPDGLLGTADDVAVPLSAGYSGTVATLGFSALPAGVYRLTILDTITDASGQRLDGDGNGLPGGNFSRDFVVAPPWPNGSFTLVSTPYTSNGPTILATGDFNGDGRVDAAVGNQAGHTVTILLGNGDGTFTAAGTYTPGGSGFDDTSALAVGDFNGDGKLDLAVLNTTSADVVILWGNGDGTFTVGPTLPVGGAPVAIAAADFSGDGRSDLAIANDNGKALDILLSGGNGTFATTSYSTGANYPLALAVGDFNGDGCPDVAVGLFCGSNPEAVEVFLNNSGVFTPAAVYSTGSVQTAGNLLLAGDFNNDGKLDLAVMDSVGSHVAILLGNGSGGFSAPTLCNTEVDASQGLAAGDFNADGKLDLLVTGYLPNAAGGNTGGVELLAGDGAGDFTAAQFLATGGANEPACPVAADLNGDGHTDVVMTNASANNLCALLDSCPPGLAVFNSPGGYAFDVQEKGDGSGQLVQGPYGAFGAIGRLVVGGTDYNPATLSTERVDNGQSLLLPAETLAGLSVSRQVTVPDAGRQDFARTVDSFTNSTAVPITTTVTIAGNLGSAAAATVFATSDGTGVVSPADQWIGTGGSGVPAVIHCIYGPCGLRPTSEETVGDNITWSYNLTVPAGQTVELGCLTVVAGTEAQAVSEAGTLVTPTGFGGHAGDYLSAGDLAALANFQFLMAPTVSVTRASGTYNGSPFAITDATVTGTPADGVIARCGDPTLSYTYYSGGTPLGGAPTHAGTYSVVAHYSSNNPNYTNADSAPSTFTIWPAPLTITANNQSMVYGAALAPLTASYTGFVGSDGPASLTTLPVVTTTATAASDVGSYPITASGAVDPDYTISYVAGTLTVMPQVIAVTSAQTMASLETSGDVQYTVGAGGWLTVGSPVVLDPGGSVSVVEGGVLTVPGINSAAGALGLELDGGTLQASGSFATAVPIIVGSGGGTTDSGGNDVTLSGAISGSGGLTITGGGNVSVTAANTYGGAPSVTSGTFVAENAAAIPGGSLLSIGAGGSVVLGAAGYAELGSISGGGSVGSNAAIAAGNSGTAVKVTAAPIAIPAGSAGTVVVVSSPAAPRDAGLPTALPRAGGPAGIQAQEATPADAHAVFLAVSQVSPPTARSPTLAVGAAKAAGGTADCTESADWPDEVTPPPLVSAKSAKSAVLAVAEPDSRAKALAPATLPGSAAAAHDHALQAETWASADEALWLDDLPGFQNRAMLPWKLRSIPDAPGLILADR